jgi:hypothetical protein
MRLRKHRADFQLFENLAVCGDFPRILYLFTNCLNPDYIAACKEALSP